MDNSLNQEIRMLRSLAVSIVGRDTEGDYRPEFVRAVLAQAGRNPNRTYTNKKDFLTELLKND